MTLNEWAPKADGSFGYKQGADEVLGRAGFLDPRQLAGQLGMELVYKAHKMDRLWGQHIHLQQRSGVTRLASSSAPLYKLPTTCKTFEKLNPYCLLLQWNHAVRPPSSPSGPKLPPIPLDSLPNFLSALPPYLLSHSSNWP